jgi:hypothetical protein
VGDFQKPRPVSAAPNFKFEREDWTSFRTIDGLQQKAGVPKGKLRRLVLKELTDNALDSGARIVKAAPLPAGGYIIEDNGPGIDGPPEEIARLFSIRRPMLSTKLWRLPSRGALGNGLRVVAGAVLASQGTLTVTTGERRIRLRPEHDGSTTVVGVETVRFASGTKVEIAFGPALPSDDENDVLLWAQIAQLFASVGTSYRGKPSPWWYEAASFHELLLASGNRPVRELIAALDGCGGDRADEIVDEAGLSRALCQDVTPGQAKTLLHVAWGYATPVRPQRLGAVGREMFHNFAYACVRGVNGDQAEIPYVVEARAKLTDEMSIDVCVNRTPVTGAIEVARDKRDIDAFGCGLSHTIAKAPKDKQFAIWLHITTPYMPITSDGKEPDLTPFLASIQAAVSRVIRKAHKPTPEPDNGSLLPKRRRGRQSPADEAAHRRAVKRFCKLVLQIKSTLDFGVGSRGYCYLLEQHGLGKGDFDAAEKLITACRKSGDLPLDICAEDESRASIGVEEIDKLGVTDKVDSLVDQFINHAHEGYLPISVWDDLKVYVEVATEKLDLRNLFEPVCRELHVPITNLKGWSDVNARAVVMRRFAYWHARGKKCVLLVCGDHDPGGLLITKTMRKNLNDLAGAMQKNYRIDWQAVDAIDLA